jgi:hypothetical protein
VSLTKENSDKLIPTGLYSHEPIDDRFTATSGNYHCKNWTFRIKEGTEGRWWAIDTYFDSWDSHRIEVTDANFHEFSLVVDMETIEKVSQNEFELSADDAKYCLAVDSGGRSYPKFFRIKGRKAMKSKYRAQIVDKIESAKRSLEWAEGELVRFDEDKDGYFAKYYEGQS